MMFIDFFIQFIYWFSPAERLGLERWRLEEGSGPAKGWVSVRVSGKDLVERI